MYQDTVTPHVSAHFRGHEMSSDYKAWPCCQHSTSALIDRSQGSRLSVHGDKSAAGPACNVRPSRRLVLAEEGGFAKDLSGTRIEHLLHEGQASVDGREGRHELALVGGQGERVEAGHDQAL